MSDAAASSRPRWLELYNEALLELDRSRLRQRIEDATAAILLRLNEVSSQGESAGEAEPLHGALAVLGDLKTQLGRNWRPSFRTER